MTEEPLSNWSVSGRQSVLCSDILMMEKKKIKRICVKVDPPSKRESLKKVFSPGESAASSFK